MVEKLGRYQIVDVLGQGAMGKVYLANDPVLGRHVAIKVLRDDLGLPPDLRATLLTRMRNEAMAAAKLSHPGMVTLHDMGEDAVVGLYLVFEYIEGPTLRDRIRESPLSLTELVQLAHDIGMALRAAHDAGIVHRDVKPENILMSPLGAKITDFGIARIPESTLTQANTLMGTAAYSAPEALGRGDFTPLSDQFAMAATLYEAVSGVRAFAGSDPLAVSHSIANQEPPPFDAALGEPRAMARLLTVLRRGMAKDRALRFDSCDELGRAVARALDTGVTLTEPPLSISGEYAARTSVMIRKATHRFQNVAVALALLLLISLVVFGKKSPRDTGDASLKDAGAAFVQTISMPPRASSTVKRPAPPAPTPAPTPAPSLPANLPSDSGAAPTDAD